MFFKPPPGPVDSSQHFSVRLPLRVCKNILHSNIDKYQFQYILHILISQSKQQTDWIYFLLSGDSRWAKYLCLSLWWWELSSCHCHLWQVRANVLHQGRAALQSLQLQSAPPPWSALTMSRSGPGLAPGGGCQTWLMASLDQPRPRWCEECGERG